MNVTLQFTVVTFDSRKEVFNITGLRKCNCNVDPCVAMTTDKDDEEPKNTTTNSIFIVIGTVGGLILSVAIIYYCFMLAAWRNCRPTEEEE